MSCVGGAQQKPLRWCVVELSATLAPKYRPSWTAATASGGACRQRSNRHGQPSAASLPRIQPGAAEVQPHLCQPAQESKAYAPGGDGESCSVWCGWSLVEGGTYRGLFQALRGDTSVAQLSGPLSPSIQPRDTSANRGSSPRPLVHRMEGEGGVGVWYWGGVVAVGFGGCLYFYFRYGNLVKSPGFV